MAKLSTYTKKEAQDSDEFVINRSGTTYKVTRQSILKPVTQDIDSLNEKIQNDIQSLSGNKLDKAGDTMTGALTLSGGPSNNLHAATKKYVDDEASNRVHKDGSVAMTGALDMNSNKIKNLADPAYTDTQYAVTVNFFKNRSSSNLKDYDPTSNSNNFPSDWGGDTIRKGHRFRIDTAGDITDTDGDTHTVEVGDVIEALTDSPGNQDDNWVILQNNLESATESSEGKIEIATTTETENLSDDNRAVTPAKLGDAIDEVLRERITVSSGSKSLSEGDAGIIGVTYTTSGTVTITLPGVSGLSNSNRVVYKIKDEGGNASSNNITITASDNIDGSGSDVKITNDYGATLIYTDGSNWFTLEPAASTFTLSSVLSSGNTTGANNISVNSGQKIVAGSGNSELNLRDGTDSKLSLTTDSGGKGDDGAFITAQQSSMTEVGFMDTATKAIGLSAVQDGTAVSGGNPNSILVMGNTNNNASSHSTEDNPAVFIGTKNSTINSGVINSVVIGGSGRTATSDNTVYTGNDLDVGGRVIVGAFSQGSPGITFGADSDTGIHKPGTDILAISAGGSTTIDFRTNTIKVADNIDINLGTTNGTKIGAGTSEKLSFWAQSPTTQPSSTGSTAGFTQSSGTTVKDSSTFTGDTGSKAYTIDDIVKHLKTIGLIASS